MGRVWQAVGEGTTMLLELVSTDEALATDDWRRLYESQVGPANPFCAPLWVTTWYRHFVPDADRRLCFIRDSGGVLIGVAPLWLDRERFGPVSIATRLRFVGAGQGTALLELPQLLAAPEQGRHVLTLIAGELARSESALSGVDWTDLVVAEGQGWLDPSWVVPRGQALAFWKHQDTQASVVLELGETWPTTLTRLKRNVKESLRRSRNRLAKLGKPHEVTRRGRDLDLPAVDRFLDLHRSRADRGGAARHHDAFAEPWRRRFMRDLLPRLGEAGEAAIWELWLDGRQVAAQLVLHAPGTLYVHSSGFDPETWELGPVTHLQEHAFRAACEAGDRWVNLSPGPNLAKLRWSERLLRHDEFTLGFGSRGTLARLAVVAGARTLRRLFENARGNDGQGR